METQKLAKILEWRIESTRMGFFTPDACDFEVEPVSNVNETEDVIEKEDREMWKRSWDIRGVKDFVNFSFPNVKEKVDADEEVQKLLGLLAKAMGGESSARPYTWPVVLILATRSD